MTIKIICDHCSKEKPGNEVIEYVCHICKDCIAAQEAKQVTTEKKV